MSNYDSVLSQTKNIPDVGDRATLVLQSIVDARQAAGEDKTKRTEADAALKTALPKLAQAIAGP